MSIGKIIFSKGLARTIGAGALALTAYDTAKMAHVKSAQNTVSQESDYLADMYLSHRNTSVCSPTGEKVRTLWRNKVADSNLLRPIRGAVNFVVSLAKEVAGNVVPLALSTVALLSGTKFKKPILKQLGKLPPVVGKLAAIPLALQAAKCLIYDTMGIGKRSTL